MTEKIEKFDSLFVEEQEMESMEPQQTMNLLGSVICKAAHDDNKESVKASMQYAYQLAKRVEVWANDEDAESVLVPKELVSAVQKDDSKAPVIPVSEAMSIIKDKFAVDDKSETIQTEKSDIVWGADLAAGELEETIDWGADLSAN